MSRRRRSARRRWRRPSTATRVTVYPRFNASYAAFCFEGLYRRYGVSCVRYSRQGFPEIHHNSGVLLLRVGSDPEQRLCIASYDHAELLQSVLAWCDVYAKVNLDWSLVPPGARHKVVAVGPTFGVRTWSASAAAREALRTRAADARHRIGARGFTTQWRKRLPESAYRAGESEVDYVFFAAWPWKKHPEVNPARASFIEVCRSFEGLRFEGGFAPRRRNDMPEFNGLYADQRYSLRHYLARLSRSLVAFNTPAVHDCLGWKLGEFLALGKAIVTLPLTRELPAPLEHGVHVHMIDGTRDSMVDALDRISRDREYRQALERNARAWYEEWLAPAQLMARLLRDDSVGRG